GAARARPACGRPAVDPAEAGRGEEGPDSGQPDQQALGEKEREAPERLHEERYPALLQALDQARRSHGDAAVATMDGRWPSIRRRRGMPSSVPFSPSWRG